MRDDIHKSAPVPRRWRHAIKVVNRGAGWRDDGPRAVDAAVRDDLAQALDNDFPRQLERAIASCSNELPGIPPDTSAIEALPQNPLQQCAAQHAARMVTDRSSEASAARALELAAQEQVSRRLREIDVHIAAQPLHAQHRFRSRLAECTASVPVGKHVADVVKNKLRRGLDKAALSLDTPLPPGPNGRRDA